jgi:hypothetical protein
MLGVKKITATPTEDPDWSVAKGDPQRGILLPLIWYFVVVIEGLDANECFRMGAWAIIISGIFLHSLRASSGGFE